MSTRTLHKKLSGVLTHGVQWPTAATWWRPAIADFNFWTPLLLGMRCQHASILKIQISTRWQGCWHMVLWLWESICVAHAMASQTAVLWMHYRQNPAVQKQPGSFPGSGATVFQPSTRRGCGDVGVPSGVSHIALNLKGWGVWYQSSIQQDVFQVKSIKRITKSSSHEPTKAEGSSIQKH